MHIRLLAAAALTAIAVPATALATAQDTYKLSGKADVPMGAPNGSGTAEIDLKSNQVCWSFKTKGIDKPTAAHIHKGVAGKAGPVVVAFGATYKASGCVKAPKAT